MEQNQLDKSEQRFVRQFVESVKPTSWRFVTDTDKREFSQRKVRLNSLPEKVVKQTDNARKVVVPFLESCIQKGHQSFFAITGSKRRPAEKGSKSFD